MTCPDLILRDLRDFLDQQPGLGYARVCIGPYPPHAGNEANVVRLCPSDVIIRPPGWPEEAVFVVIVYCSQKVALPQKAYLHDNFGSVMDMFEHLRMRLHMDSTLGGEVDGCEITSAKFDIKKHSWGAKERLDDAPIFEVEVYLSIAYHTLIPG